MAGMDVRAISRGRGSVMKSIAAVLVLAGAACQSAHSAGNTSDTPGPTP